MKMKRLISFVIVLLLICGMPVSAFADSWYLENGNITVNATESGQTVTQGTNVDVPDSAPVITQSNSSTPTTNTITITATENATANVTIQDVNIVISDPTDNPQNHSGQAAVTIDVADGASANVTLDGVNINTKNTGGEHFNVEIGEPSNFRGEAAVQITGNGDVTMELDGENTVQSGDLRAGVEKNTIAATGTNPSSGNGELTITDENGTSGTLKATGGSQGSGIGGGWNGSGSNITITGSAEVTATGGNSGAGIGGGALGSGSNITIEGNANVTANGGDQGSGIGGGIGRSGSDIIITESAKVTAKGGTAGSGIGGGNGGSGSNITITGSAEVTAKGGVSGAGIGGGYRSTGSSNITVSQDAQVKAQGGIRSQLGPIYYGAGAAIGDGGKYSNSSQDNIAGDEVTPNTDALDEGWIATYAPGTTNLDTATPKSLTYKDASGTVQTEEDPQNIQLVGEQPATSTAHGHKAGFQIGNQMVAVTIHSFTNYVSDNNATYDADGTKTAQCDHCDATHTIPDPGSKLVREETVQPTQPAQPAAPYRVVGKDGKALSCKAERQDGVLTITVEADIASLTGKLGGIQTLKALGIDTIVFVTNGATPTFALSDLLSQGSTGNSYTLTHDGSTVTFTLNNGSDVSAILQ